jgi:hypothetical protein
MRCENETTRRRRRSRLNEQHYNCSLQTRLRNQTILSRKKSTANAEGGWRLRLGQAETFCQDCVGFERAAITGCAAYAGPLWNLRPYQKA